MFISKPRARAILSIGILSIASLAVVTTAYEKPGEGAINPLSYSLGDKIQISCLNRTIDTGEHVQDEKTGLLQYVPFATCNETGRPLELEFLSEKDINCTVPFLSDEMFHLLEFYIHHDSPLTCRIPARPLGGERDLTGTETGGEEFVPLTFAIAGKLEKSHLHVAPNLNLLLHLAPRTSPESPLSIDSGVSYSTSPLQASSLARIVIGDPLPLRFRVRWYPTPELPAASSRTGSHFTRHTFVYCLLSAFCGGILVYVFTIGWQFPRRLRERVGLAGKGRGGGPGIIAGNVVGRGGGYGGYGYVSGGGGDGNGFGYGYVSGGGGEGNGYGYGGYGGYGGGGGKRKD
ncbi:hypothetical protein RUND412_008325 [Rhizina undulata]